MRVTISQKKIYFDLIPDSGEITGYVYGYDERGKHLTIAKVHAHHKEKVCDTGARYTPVEQVEWRQEGLKKLCHSWNLSNEDLDQLRTYLIQTLWETSGQYPKLLGGEICYKQVKFEFVTTKIGYYNKDGEVIEDNSKRENKQEDKEEGCSPIILWTAALAFLAEVGVLIGLVVLYVRAFL